MVGLFYVIGLFCLAGVGFWFALVVVDDLEFPRKDQVVTWGPAALCVLLVVVYVVPNRPLVASIGGIVVGGVVCAFLGAFVWDLIEQHQKQSEPTTTETEEDYVEQVNGYGDIPPEIVEKQKEWRRHV